MPIDIAVTDAMANHGILPYDGRNISMKILQRALEDTFNFSPTLTRNTTDSLVSLFGRDTIDLGYVYTLYRMCVSYESSCTLGTSVAIMWSNMMLVSFVGLLSVLAVCSTIIYIILSRS